MRCTTFTNSLPCTLCVQTEYQKEWINLKKAHEVVGVFFSGHPIALVHCRGVMYTSRSNVRSRLLMEVMAQALLLMLYRYSSGSGRQGFCQTNQTNAYM